MAGQSETIAIIKPHSNVATTHRRRESVASRLVLFFTTLLQSKSWSQISAISVMELRSSVIYENNFEGQISKQTYP